MTFQIHALSPDAFRPLFELSDDDLAQRKTRRLVATSPHGFPCRVSLQDAAVGEEILLTHFTHQSAHSPYHASHAIFVRKNAIQAHPAPGEVPEMISRRLLSVRAFDAAHMLVTAEVLDGNNLAPYLTRTFDDRSVSYIHLHTARQGCYDASVTRA